jgi:hypothetical protein
MSHYTMHATVNYPALPPTSPLQLPLPYLPPPPPPLSLAPWFPPPQTLGAAAAASSPDSSFQSRISPSVLLIILILAVIFFVSGLLHLLVRFLLRPPPRGAGDALGAGGDASHGTTAFQGQLQQLFHLHDAGVDQAFIDTLPVFLYGAVVGAGRKDAFDCAVCLCEFEDGDRLRLLPKCSHAFHVDCIDTWLLSHSTCPLCRSSLLADFSSSYGGACSPLVFVLESGSEGSASDRHDAAPSARLSFVMEEEGSGRHAAEAAEKKDEVVVPVKLGKFRSQVTGAEAGGGPDQDVRRCFSMGTYEYVMDDSSLLRVAVKPPAKKRLATRMPGHSKRAMSECDCHSKREGFRGFDAPPPKQQRAVDKRESFSVSKIWMRGAPRRKEPATSCSTSRRASSFRLASAPQRTASDVGAAAAPKLRADAVSPVTESEYNVSAWDKSATASVVDWDVESGHGLSSRADEASSFARRTLLWIRGHL